ncbi:MAG: amidohydrolase family protein [Steroidobacteraceae bacterium]
MSDPRLIDPSRRRALQALLWLGTAAVTRRAGAGSPAGCIDVHHHFIPDAFRRFWSAPGRGPAPPMQWTLEADLAEMDRGGIDTALLSMFTPYDAGSTAERQRLSREINEAGAALVAAHPRRFGLLATLPLPDLDASLAEAAHALDQLHADGLALYTNSGDRWLGHASFAPLLAELNRRAAVVFVHPTTAACCRGLVQDVPDPVVEYGTDTSRCIASLVFSGTLARFPDIRFIFSHGGGTMPFLIERFLGGSAAELVPGVVTEGQSGPYAPHQPPGGALAAIRRLHFDTAQCANPVAMRALRGVVPASQVLFGSDYFYRSPGGTVRALEHCGVFDRRELHAVERGNALRLFPRLRVAAPPG